jgi:OOP family OmpA-OmpF porin
MKKYCARLLSLVIVSTLFFGCAAPQVQQPKSLFSPSQLHADHYQPKVDNFMVILDTSSSMSDKYRGYSKFKIAKDYLGALNQTLPELDYNGALRTFDTIVNDSEKSTLLVYGPTKYSTAGFESALNGVKGFCEDSSISLAKAIAATEKDFNLAQGTTAIIIISDGEDMDQMSVKAVQNLKNQLSDRVCIYTIRIGDDPAGIKQMEKIAETGACGFPVVVVDRKTSDTMGDLVERVFLAKAEKVAPKSVQVAKPIDSDGDGVTDDKDQCPNTPIGVTVDVRGCWTYSAVVLFDFGSTKIKSKAHPMLNETSDILKKNPEINFEIDGHTDNIGSAEYNTKLSEGRANAVMEYLVSKGVDAKRLTAKGFGLTKPAASNDTQEGRAKNRRVELTPLN